MFYWIRLQHWEHGFVERQYDVTDSGRRELEEFMYEHLEQGWYVSLIKICNMTDEDNALMGK